MTGPRLESHAPAARPPCIPPSPSHTLAIINLITAQKIRLILVEPYFDTKTPKYIAGKTGAKVLITLTGKEPKRLTGRVVRCQVCAIHRDGTMTYQTALALDQPAGLDNIAVDSSASTAVTRDPETAREAVPVPSAAPRLVNQW